MIRFLIVIAVTSFASKGQSQRANSVLKTAMTSHLKNACPAPAQWTNWYNRDTPGQSGDYENLINIRKEYPGQVCKLPIGVEGQLLDGSPWQSGGDTVSISPTNGLVCVNAHQDDKLCNNYKVRFCCKNIENACALPARWTNWYNRDNPGGNGDYEDLKNTRKEYPGQVCQLPIGVEGQLLDGSPWQNGGDTVSISPTNGLVCVNANQADKLCNNYKIRFCCKNIENACAAPARWTNWYNRDNPGGYGDYENLITIRKEYPGQVCEHPIGVDGQLLDGRPWQNGEDIVSISPTIGLICVNTYQDDGRCNNYKVRFCCMDSSQNVRKRFTSKRQKKTIHPSRR